MVVGAKGHAFLLLSPVLCPPSARRVKEVLVVGVVKDLLCPGGSKEGAEDEDLAARKEPALP